MWRMVSSFSVSYFSFYCISFRNVNVFFCVITSKRIRSRRLLAIFTSLPHCAVIKHTFVTLVYLYYHLIDDSTGSLFDRRVTHVKRMAQIPTSSSTYTTIISKLFLIENNVFKHESPNISKFNVFVFFS